VRQTLDRLTGALTMYRLVLGSLLAIGVVALVLSLLGELAYTPLELLRSAAVAIIATVATGWLFARVFRTRAHLESSIITALLLWMLFLPSLEPGELLALALACAIASASKYLLAVRGRHVFNPAAIGAAVVALLQVGYAGWWIATPPLLPVVALGALLVLYRTRRLAIGGAFVLVSMTIVVARLALTGTDVLTAASTALTSYPIVFLAGFMLSEPLTLPPRRWQQLVVATLVGVLFAVPYALPPVYSSPELALVVGNLVAFVFGQRRGIRLTSVGTRRLTATTWEFAFQPSRPITFTPGQYLELSLPHARSDARGSRRIFSISSAPSLDGPITVAMTISDPPSSFKAAMLALEPGDAITGTLVGGDFLLPRDAATPVLLIAGGIGITPFASQLADARARGEERDIVVVYAVRDATELPYADLLEGVRVVLLAPQAPPRLPDRWTYAGSGRLTVELLRQAVPDVADRRVYVSGPPSLVNAARPIARASGARRITTDSFSGY